MAKLAVFLFAAFAIYAAAAYEHRYPKSEYDVKQFNDYDFQTYMSQMKTLTTDLTEHYHGIVTDDTEYAKFLTWQSRYLCQYLDVVMEKLNNKDLYHGKDKDFLNNILEEFKEIQVVLHRLDAMNVVELKKHLVISINKTFEQIEKFVNWFRMHYTETQGSLAYVVKSLVFDFVKLLQDFDYKFKNFGFATTTSTITTTGLYQWGMQIDALTRELIQCFDHTYLNNVHFKDALRRFFHNLEAFKSELKENNQYVNAEFITMFDEMYQRFYDIILPVVETTKYDRFVKVDLWKREFVTELETICKDILRWVERYETKYQSTEYYMTLEKILKSYLYTIYNLKTDLTKYLEEYNTQYYGKTDLKKGVFGLDTYDKDMSTKSFYNKDMYTGDFYNKDLSTKSFYNKDMHAKNFYNKDMSTESFYNKDMYTGDFYNKDLSTKSFYNKDMHAKNFYNKDMSTESFYNKDMYTKNFYNRDMSTKNFYNKDVYNKDTQLLSQIQTITHELTHTLEYVNIDIKTLKQFFIIETLKYTYQIHNIIEKLNILCRSTKTETQVIEKIIFNLREVLASLQQVGTTVDTTTVLKNWLNTKIVLVNAEIEKLLMVNFTQNNDQRSIVLVRSVLIEYLTTVQNLKYCFDNIMMINENGPTIEKLVHYLEFLMNDLFYCFRYVNFSDAHVKDTALLEFHNLEKFIETIVEKINAIIEYKQVPVCLRRIVGELKAIQLMVREFITMEYKDLNQMRVNYELVLCRTFYVLREFDYIIRPEMESHLKVELVNFLKCLYVDFFHYVQCCEIQFLNAVPRDYVKQLSTEWTYSRTNINVDTEVTTTYQLFGEVKKMVYDFTTFFRGFETLKHQEDLHLFQTEVYKLVHIVEKMLEQLKEHARMVKGDVMFFNRVIDELETSLLPLKRFSVYTTVTDFDSFKMHVTKFLHVFVEEFEQLVSYHEEYKGTFDSVFKKMLYEFFMTLRNIKYQFRFGYDKTMMYKKDYKYGYDRFDKTYTHGVHDYTMKPYVKDADRFDVNYGKMDHFYKKFDFGLKDDLCKYHKGEQSFDDLMKNIDIFCGKLIKNVEMYVNDKQGRDALVYYVRELIKIIDTMTYKFEGVVTVENKEFVYRFIESLKLIKTDLYQFVHSDVITTVYQMKSQYTYVIRKICSELVQCFRDCKQLTSENESIVYDIFYQYFVYLRTVCLKLQKGDDFEATKYNFENVHLDNLRLHEFAQDVKYIVDKVQSKIHLIKDKDMVIVRQVLLKLKEILGEIYGDVSEIKYEYFQKTVQDVTYELQNWMSAVEQYGYEHDLYVLAKDVLFDFRRAVQKLYFQDKDLIHLYA